MILLPRRGQLAYQPNQPLQLRQDLFDASKLIAAINPAMGVFDIASNSSPASSGINIVNGAIKFTGSSTQYIDLGVADQILDPSNYCLILSTVRYSSATDNGASFGYSDSDGSNRVLLHFPYSDNNLYFDYGNASTGRISVSISSYLSVGTINNFAFYAGSRGREIWRNGVLLASDSGKTATRSSSGSARYYLGAADNSQGGSVSSSYSDVQLIVATRQDMSQAALSQATENPWQLFEPARSFIFIPASAGGLSQSSRFDNVSTFYAATVAPGPVTLDQSARFDNSNAFYSATVTQGGATQSLTQSARFDNSGQFYAATVSPGAVTLTQSVRLDNSSEFYSATVTSAGSLVQSARFDSVNQFFSGTVTPGAITVQAPFISDANTFFTHVISVSGGPQSISQDSRLDNGNSFYGGSVSIAGSVTLSPADIDAIATAVWAKVLEGFTAEEMMRIMFAAMAGKREGIGSAVEYYMAADGVTPRITFAVDVNGNGTPVVNGSA